MNYMEKGKKPPIQFTARFAPALHRKVLAHANRKNITFNHALNQLLEKHFETK